MGQALGTIHPDWSLSNHPLVLTFLLMCMSVQIIIVLLLLLLTGLVFAGPFRVRKAVCLLCDGCGSFWYAHAQYMASSYPPSLDEAVDHSKLHPYNHCTLSHTVLMTSLLWSLCSPKWWSIARLLGPMPSMWSSWTASPRRPLKIILVSYLPGYRSLLQSCRTSSHF